MNYKIIENRKFSKCHQGSQIQSEQNGEKHPEYAELAFIVASAYANGILIAAYFPEHS